MPSPCGATQAGTGGGTASRPALAGHSLLLERGQSPSPAGSLSPAGAPPPARVARCQLRCQASWVAAAGCPWAPAASCSSLPAAPPRSGRQRRLEAKGPRPPDTAHGQGWQCQAGGAAGQPSSGGQLRAWHGQSEVPGARPNLIPLAIGTRPPPQHPPSTHRPHPTGAAGAWHGQGSSRCPLPTLQQKGQGWRQQLEPRSLGGGKGG